MPLIKQVFPEQIKKLREAIGVSQEEFARALGVSRPTISYYEKGDRIPDIEMLDRIVETTGCSMEYLMGYSDNMKPGNVDIGMFTALSDKAIDVLTQYDGYSRIISFIIEHDLYPKLMGAIDVYPDANFFSGPSFSVELDGGGFVKYIIAQVIGQIVDDYDEAHPSRLGDRPRERVESIHKTYEHFDHQITGVLRDIEEEARKKALQEREKIAYADPVTRFRERMEGRARDEKSGEDAQKR